MVTKKHIVICSQALVCSLLLLSKVYAEVPKSELTGSERAIEFFKEYLYVPSSRIFTKSMIDRLEIRDILKILDDRIFSSIDKILEQNKIAQGIYTSKDKSADFKEEIREYYINMANIYESLSQVDSRVRELYPEIHMHKLFDVLQKIYATQYQVTYNPEEDNKSFWNVFKGS